MPDAYVNRDAAVNAPIEVGGGSPMIYSFVNGRGTARVIVLTQEAMVMGHVIAKLGIAGIKDLKGKRIGFSGVGSVTHFRRILASGQPLRASTFAPHSNCRHF